MKRILCLAALLLAMTGCSAPVVVVTPTAAAPSPYLNGEYLTYEELLNFFDSKGIHFDPMNNARGCISGGYNTEAAIIVAECPDNQQTLDQLIANWDNPRHEGALRGPNWLVITAHRDVFPAIQQIYGGAVVVP